MEQNQLVVRMAVDAWDTQVKRANDVLNTLTDEQLEKEVAPGKNRGVYLLGHLTAVNDRMMSLLGIGERSYPQLDEAFLANPDKSGFDMPSVSELKQFWNESNTQLTNHFSNMTPDDWFQKHTSVSDEDFSKEPHRNRLNVLLSRTSHLAYHMGQVVLVK